MLSFAIGVAHQAGRLLKQYYTSDLDIRTKSTDRDLVTQADLDAEKIIISAIKETFPTHAILAEEKGQIGHADYLWLIDPLDGTTNFAHGHPVFCTSIGLAYQGEMCVAVILDPIRNELFAAEKGKGASLNEKPIMVSDTKTLNNAVVATGFPYDRATNPHNNLKEFGQIMPLVQGIRRCGSAALDMAYVASGRLDGYWEYHIKPWDVGAGALMVKEAGGRVTSIDNSPWRLDSSALVAGNPNIHHQILENIR
ncbi:MAG: inositol monophosphatase [SAR324 cluster bacterium]|nr:inositol monophosphatase [SAR324 cluster bacterium]